MVNVVYYIAAFDPAGDRKYTNRVDFVKQFSAIFKTLCNVISKAIVISNVTFYCLFKSVIGIYVR